MQNNSSTKGKWSVKWLLWKSVKAFYGNEKIIIRSWDIIKDNRQWT